MKKCYFLILIICLVCGAGFPLYSQEALFSRKDSTRLTIENPENIRELQQQAEPQKKEEPQDKTKVKLTGSQLVIEDLPEDGVLEIYNIMGAKVFNRRVKAGTNQYILSLPKGYYIIKIGKFTRKIAIR
ncbi:T9SS type A sorting domain-containing protein [Proteiniphilum sp.]|uniref:T9SS type A sorting domain-containing protein n=1 Tax=Proteiniphilum sp. TaxID=1926877 RepID=UPI00332F78CB